MEARRGRIENGVVVLSDPGELPEGAEVTVLYGADHAPVEVGDEELALIDAALVEAKRPHRLEARAFLRELRRS